MDEISHQIQSSRRRSGIDRLYPPGLLEAEFDENMQAKGLRSIRKRSEVFRLWRFRSGLPAIFLRELY